MLIQHIISLTSKGFLVVLEKWMNPVGENDKGFRKDIFYYPIDKTNNLPTSQEINLARILSIRQNLQSIMLCKN